MLFIKNLWGACENEILNLEIDTHIQTSNKNETSDVNDVNGKDLGTKEKNRQIQMIRT